MNPITPSLTLLVKLGSIAVHIEEWISPHGKWIDRDVIIELLNDPEVKEWREAMDKMALLPVKR